MTRWQAVRVEKGHQHLSGIAGIRAGNLVFLSAIRGVDPETQRPVPDTEGQARQALENARVALEAAGGTLSDVVKVGVYMRALQRDRRTFDTAWVEYFPDVQPARFAVESPDFGAPDDGSLFLLDIVAVLGD